MRQEVLWGLPEDFPWGQTCTVEIPTRFWSDDWLDGVRSRKYVGMICSHSNPAEGDICVQPWSHSQAHRAPCVPFDPETAVITVLPGKLQDY